MFTLCNVIGHHERDYVPYTTFKNANESLKGYSGIQTSKTWRNSKTEQK